MSHSNRTNRGGGTSPLGMAMMARARKAERKRRSTVSGFKLPAKQRSKWDIKGQGRWGLGRGYDDPMISQLPWM